MDLFDVVRSCIRRWYVVLPLLLIVAWYSHHAYKSAKPVYYVSAVIGVASPNTHMDIPPQGVAVPRNGLLDGGGGSSMIANMLTLDLNDPSVWTQVAADGGANYMTKMFPVPATMAELPMVMIETTQADPGYALKTVELVVQQAEPTLRKLQRQANVPDDQMVTSFVVSPPSVPAAGMPSRTRSTISIAAAGAGIAILVGVVVDVLLMRWKARRQTRRQNRQQTQVQAADGADTANGATNAYPLNKHATDEVAVDSR